MLVHVTSLIRIMLCSDHCLAGVETFTLSVDVHNGRRSVALYKEGEKQDSISLNDPSAPQTSTLLAYRPQYADLHKSGLAGLFVKIQGVYPCTQGIANYEPVCTTFTRDEDGFRKAKRFIQAADTGNNMQVFGGDSVFALAVEGCPEMNADCLHSWAQIDIVCMLSC